jgi:Protein of unknown function (DUF3016)
MRIAPLAVLAFLLAAQPVFAQGAVTVRFVAPERFVDDDFRNRTKGDAVMRELDRFLQTLGRRYLRPGDVMRLDVLDVQLAGHYEPFRTRGAEIRVMRETTPPSVRLRYRLTRSGRDIAQGEETVLDLNYLSNTMARNASEWLAFEKAMLRDWFRRRFGAVGTAASG